MKILLGLFLVLILSSCSQTEEYPDDGVHPAAISAQSFLPEAPLPKREKNRTRHFFFKDCEVGGRKYYYSSTSYNCDDLNF